jgi:hypothetical protein
MRSKNFLKNKIFEVVNNMKSFSFINKKMTIKIHLFYSFLVHSIILTYLLSLPVYKGSIHLKSFEDYFVYLTNEQSENAGRPFLTYKGKKSETLDQGRIEDTKTVLKTEEVDAKNGPQPLGKDKMVVSEQKPEQIIETATGEKVAQATENKVPLEPSGVEKSLKEEPSKEEKEIETVKKEVAPLLAEKRKEVEKPREEVQLDTGTISSFKEKVFADSDKAGKEKVIVLKGGITEVKVFEKTPQEVKKPPTPFLPETDVGLFLKTLPGNMMIPFEEAFKEEVHVKKEIKTEGKAGHKVKEAAKGKAASEKINEIKESSRIEGVSKGKAPAIKEKAIRLAKKEVHRAEELEAKEAGKSPVDIKPDKVAFDASLKKKAPVLKKVSEAEEATKDKGKDKGFKEEGSEVKVSEKKTLKAKETPSPAIHESFLKTDAELSFKTVYDNMMMPFEETFKEETSHAGKEVVAAGKTGHEMRGVAENKATSAKANEVKKFSKVEKVLKEEVPAVKEIAVAKKEIRKSEGLLAQKANVKSFPQTKKIKETAKPQKGEKLYKGVFGTAVSPLKEKASVLKSVSSGSNLATKEKAKGLKEETAKVKASEERPLKIQETPSQALPETDVGLFLKTLSGNMMIPFEEAFKEEGLQAGKEITTAKKEMHKAEKLEAEDTSLKAKKTSSLAFSEKDIGTPDKPIYNKVTASEERLEEKTPQVRDKEELGVEILTPERNTMPSQKDYFLKLDNKKQITTEIKPEVKEETIVEEKSPPLGIPVPDVLLLKDIRIEVFLKDADISDVLLHLLKKAHPMENRKDDSVKQKEIEVVEETYIAGTSGIKRVFYVAKAEKGLYTFVIMNKGNKAYKADVVFRLFERKAGERIKEYKTVELPPNTALKLKFILPEAVFWDDEYYFTGTIESSNTLTKFNDKTGLIWKEEKDY